MTSCAKTFPSNFVMVTDGINRAHHPVFVYVFPTFKLEGDNS